MPPFTYQIDEIVFSNYSVTWEEALDASRANLSVVVPRMQIADLNSNAETPFVLDAEYRIGEAGQVKIDGSVLPAGSVLDLEIVIDALPLDSLSPYAQYYGDTTIASGQLGFSGRLQYAGEGEQTLGGVLSIDGIDLIYAENLQASWSSLKLDGLDLNLAPFSLGLDSVSLAKPHFVYTLLASESEAVQVEPPAEPGKGQSTGTPVRIDQIEISEGHVTFNDQSIEPSPKIVMDALTLNVSDLDLGGNAPANIGLSTQLNGSALQVDGSLNVNDLKEATRLKATLSGLSLPAFSPYSGQARASDR